MTAHSTSLVNDRPVLGVALMADDLGSVEGLRDFVFDLEREIEIQDFIAVEALSDDWRGIAAHIRRALDGHRGRVGIHGPFLGFALDTPDPDIRAIAQARLEAGILACAVATGGRGDAHMVVHSPYTTWSWHNRGITTQPYETQEMVQATLAPAVRRAEQEGVTIVIENIEDKDPAERVALARTFDSDFVKVSLDTGHAHYAHGVTGAPPVDVYVRAAGDSLAHVHLQDTDAFADRHWAIGEGTIRWESVFTALGELQERPRLIMEVPAEKLMASAAWLEARGLGI